MFKNQNSLLLFSAFLEGSKLSAHSEIARVPAGRKGGKGANVAILLMEHGLSGF
jgi:hypothetical protein